MDKINIFFQQEEMIHKSIRFADQKAAILLTTNAAFLFALIQTKPTPESCWGIAFYGACIIHLAAIFLCFWVLKPRGTNVDLSDSEIQVKMDDPSYALLGMFDRMDEQEGTSPPNNFSAQFEPHFKKIISHCLRIDQKKYKWLRHAIYLSMVSWVVGFIILLFRNGIQ